MGYEAEIELLRRRGGVVRMSEAIGLGLSRHALYGMRDGGQLEELTRGVYRLAELPPPTHPDLLAVALRVPRGVLCLVSALAWHELTTEVPHAVHLALPRGMTRPRIDYPPTEIYWFSPVSYGAGIERHAIDGAELQIYSPEKSVADAFKYRRKLGLDLAIEALRLWRERRGTNVEALLEQARACRVESVMRPYLEALL